MKIHLGIQTTNLAGAIVFFILIIMIPYMTFSLECYAGSNHTNFTTFCDRGNFNVSVCIAYTYCGIRAYGCYENSSCFEFAQNASYGVKDVVCCYTDLCNNNISAPLFPSTGPQAWGPWVEGAAPSTLRNNMGGVFSSYGINPEHIKNILFFLTWVLLL
jgi:hypothetical protein